MTPDDALKLAQHVKRRKMDRPSIQLADFVIELLSTQMPCGFAKPALHQTPDGPVVMIDDIELGTPQEAEAIGVAIVRVARPAAQLPEQE